MAFPGLGAFVVLLSVGLVVGTISGMVGIGGGVLVIPVLIMFFGFSQAKANGTSLAMLLPPIGIFAVLSYWRAGNVDWAYAMILAVSFAVGAYLGASLVNAGRINPTMLRIMFAMLLLYVAGRILFRPGGRARVAIEISLLMSGYIVVYAVMRIFGRRLRSMPNWSQLYRDREHSPVEDDFEI